MGCKSHMKAELQTLLEICSSVCSIDSKFSSFSMQLLYIGLALTYELTICLQVGFKPCAARQMLGKKLANSKLSNMQLNSQLINSTL